MHDLHGELLLGEPGAIAVELAGAWAIIMVVTGLYLWWPRANIGLAGVLYPRLSSGGRAFLRDLHAVTGIWLSFFALFFLITALPWTRSGERASRPFAASGQQRERPQDWTTGPASARRVAWRISEAPAAASRTSTQSIARRSGHSEHAAMHAPITGFDEIAAQAVPLGLADPVRSLRPRRRGRTGS